MDEIAGCIDAVLRAIGTPEESAVLEQTRGRVEALMSRFPLPY
jgi:glycine hydroxymethyltransferase